MYGNTSGLLGLCIFKDVKRDIIIHPYSSTVDKAEVWCLEQENHLSVSQEQNV